MALRHCKLFLAALFLIGGSAFAEVYSSCSAATGLLLRFGNLAAVDSYGRSVPGAEHLPCPGKDGALSEEAIVKLGIDRAVVWEYQAASRRLFEQRGIAVLAVPPIRLAAFPEFVRSVAKFAGCEKAGEAYLKAYDADLPPPLPETVRRPRVYFELYAPYKSIGQNSYYHDLVTLAGGENIGAVLPVSGTLSPEHILKAEPEVIFFLSDKTTAGEIAARPGFSGLPAVRNNRIHPLDRIGFLEGAAPAAAVKALRSKLFPEEK